MMMKHETDNDDTNDTTINDTNDTTIKKKTGNDFVMFELVCFGLCLVCARLHLRPSYRRLFLSPVPLHKCRLNS